jgi:hypothetical protein
LYLIVVFSVGVVGLVVVVVVDVVVSVVRVVVVVAVVNIPNQWPLCSRLRGWRGMLSGQTQCPGYVRVGQAPQGVPSTPALGPKCKQSQSPYIQNPRSQEKLAAGAGAHWGV